MQYNINKVTIHRLTFCIYFAKFQISKPRNSVMGPYQNTFNRGQMGTNINRTPINISNMVPGLSAGYRPRGRSPIAVPPRSTPVHGIPIIRTGSMARHNSPVLMQSSFPIVVSGFPIDLHVFFTNKLGGCDL